MSDFSGITKSLSKLGTTLAKEGVKSIKKNKGKIITGVATTVVPIVLESGFSLFSKPYFVAFKSLKETDLENFKNQINELGFKIQITKSKEEAEFSGKVQNYFHSTKKADKFSYQLPLGLAEYYVTKLEQ